MTDDAPISKKIRSVLENDPAVNLHRSKVSIALRDDQVVLEGDVEDVIAKRRIPQLAQTVTNGHAIVDRLRLIPSEQRGDGAVLDSVVNSLSQESAFRNYTIGVQDPSSGDRSAPDQSSEGHHITVSVDNAVVTLTGSVESLTHRRLADVLAWWVTGSVDVDNRLHVVPPEQDHDGEINDAIRIVMEKDPLLDASQLRFHAKNSEVTLDGLVHSQEHKHMAECNAWLILGVHNVINRIQVQA